MGWKGGFKNPHHGGCCHTTGARGAQQIPTRMTLQQPTPSSPPRHNHNQHQLKTHECPMENRTIDHRSHARTNAPCKIVIVDYWGQAGVQKKTTKKMWRCNLPSTTPSRTLQPPNTNSKSKPSNHPPPTTIGLYLRSATKSNKFQPQQINKEKNDTCVDPKHGSTTNW